MLDPVSGFTYPAEWVSLCTDEVSRQLVRQGLAILTSDGTIRRRGFTTGTTAAAAAKAAVLSITKTGITQVSILTPVRIRVQIPVYADGGTGECIKYAGDYPGDVTAGLAFTAEADITESGISLTFGEGIGRWIRDTPRYKAGDPAVSFQARDEIINAIEEAMSETGMPGAGVKIYARQGSLVAEKTLNQMVGVAGGISILGTTGFVEPWDDHLEQAVYERAMKAERVVLTTGRIGLRYARMLFPDHEVILAGSRLGSIVPHLTGEVIICGLPALVLKYINPHILDGTNCPTVEEFMTHERFFEAMQSSFQIFKSGHPNVRIVLVNRQGTIIGDSS
ncbi:MAG TPA: cobalt-precorrin-5B (C(1))-methyltransferase [Methanospirillum sp.]|nr:cobalt-precorrin-5B (C(1))-methyltransferase [Methanospirillum sp.]HOL41258.1 cobalt-precorrin-5B (C(1))-methyltransferase [Methanospirillum sp.]HPP77973.1 cobalt-precorrin-5B (C(1))-methyltransferase [Methanospirillum sp.]